jgi:DNA helicase-2/ATP-dependent DNA helicase PcrA
VAIATGLSSTSEAAVRSFESSARADCDGFHVSPGWRRAQARGYAGGPPGRTQVIEGEGRLIAVSDLDAPGAFALGDRVFHQKFGPGSVSRVEGNKLTVAFDHAGEKRVIDSFVTRAEAP